MAHRKNKRQPPARRGGGRVRYKGDRYEAEAELSAAEYAALLAMARVGA